MVKFVIDEIFIKFGFKIVSKSIVILKSQNLHQIPITLLHRLENKLPLFLS